MNSHTAKYIPFGEARSTPALSAPPPCDNPTSSTADRFQTRFDELIAEIQQLRRAKGSDYGDDQGDNLHDAWGLDVLPSLAVLLRMGDKWRRIKTLTRKQHQGYTPAVNETRKETLRDLAVYALLCIVLIEEEED